MGAQLSQGLTGRGHTILHFGVNKYSLQPHHTYHMGPVLRLKSCGSFGTKNIISTGEIKLQGKGVNSVLLSLCSHEGGNKSRLSHVALCPFWTRSFLLPQPPLWLLGTKDPREQSQGCACAVLPWATASAPKPFRIHLFILSFGDKVSLCSSG